MLPLLFLLGCDLPRADAVEHASAAIQKAPSEPADAPPIDVFDAFLTAPFPVAAGFVAPLDSGWTSCGPTCWTAAAPRAIRAMAPGIVEIDGTTLHIHHSWYENFELRTLTMTVAGGTPNVAQTAGAPEGQKAVGSGATLATGTQITLTLEGTDEPLASFVAARRSLPVPKEEPSLALISHDDNSMRLYRDGAEVGRYQMGFGQAEGQKLRQGDNRSPKGVYYITQKASGVFGGPSAAYFGGYWMRVNYPNAFDAARAADEGWITVDEQRVISNAWRKKQETTKKTKLGGGIGIHGWAYEWDDADTRGMSWGCLVMHLYDAPAIYAEIQEGTMVVLF